MKSEKIVVWNATKGSLRLGENKVLLKPAEKMTVNIDADILSQINAGKLVVIQSEDGSTSATLDDVSEAPKKKKKETVKEEAIITSDQEDKKEEQSTTESIEPTEDSILAEEPF